MGKAGRRGKGDAREVKDATFSTRITQSQKEKLSWLSTKLRQSVADMLGFWIESVFDHLGGNLSKKPVPSVEVESFFLKGLQEGRTFTDTELVEIAAEFDLEPDFMARLKRCSMEWREERCKQRLD